MSAPSFIRLFLLFCAFAICDISFAADTAKPAASAYQAQTSQIAYRAVVTELLKHPERLRAVSMKLMFQIDRQGRVHDIKVMSKTPRGWAEETARRRLAATKFPPPSQKVLDQLGTDRVNAEAQLDIDARPQ
jgi:hypothetical protein